MTILKKNNKFRIQKEKNRYYGYILAWVFDASEEPIPDFIPNWLYGILENLEKSSGGYFKKILSYHGESMESLFEMDDTYYNALINHPFCESCEEVDTLEF